MIRDWAYSKYRKKSIIKYVCRKKNVNEPSAFFEVFKIKDQT